MENTQGLNYRARRLKAVLVMLAISFAGTARAQDGGWQKENTDWRAQHATELQKPDGWLALAGLERLEAGENPFRFANDNKMYLAFSWPELLRMVIVVRKSLSVKRPA